MGRFWVMTKPNGEVLEGVLSRVQGDAWKQATAEMGVQDSSRISWPKSALKETGFRMVLVELRRARKG